MPAYRDMTCTYLFTPLGRRMLSQGDRDKKQTYFAGGQLDATEQKLFKPKPASGRGILFGLFGCGDARSGTRGITATRPLPGVVSGGGGYPEKAEPLYRRSIAIRETAYGSDSPTLGIVLNDLAALHVQQRRYAKARALFRRSLAGLEKGLGPDHPNVAAVANNLAQAHIQQGRYAKAAPLLERALAIHEKNLGSNHPDLKQVLLALAAFHRAQGYYSRAEPLYRRVLAIQEEALGSEHPEYASSLSEYAFLLRKAERKDEAERA